jgi:hypothetical protein
VRRPLKSRTPIPGHPDSGHFLINQRLVQKEWPPARNVAKAFDFLLSQRREGKQKRTCTTEAQRTQSVIIQKSFLSLPASLNLEILCVSVSLWLSFSWRLAGADIPNKKPPGCHAGRFLVNATYRQLKMFYHQ